MQRISALFSAFSRHWVGMDHAVTTSERNEDPSMISKTIFCTAADETQADSIIEKLHAAEFSSHSISILALDPDRGGLAGETSEPNPVTVGAGLFGGQAGQLGGVAAVMIPGAGPFIAAGPIIALVGATTHGIQSGLIQALMALGIPEPQAKVYEGKISEGNVLISVNTNGSEIVKAWRVFDESDGRDITITAMGLPPQNSISEAA
jgi:hypothetical protein